MRKATELEAKTYEAIEAQVIELDDKKAQQVVEEVSDFVFSWGEARKKAYNKCRKWAKKFNCSVPDLETWYCVEEY